MHRSALREFLVPVLFLLLATAAIGATGLDLFVERGFYLPGAGWAVGDLPPLRLLYRFGVLPAYLLALVALGTLIGGFWSRNLNRYRRYSFFFLLLLALGPGLLVNTVFKDHWGRPRPSHLAVFGGREAKSFHQVWERGVAGEGKSFPSGHASMAFYLMTPYFVLRSRSRRGAYLWLAGGIAYGLVMGVARMAQGGHFPSDVLWAGGMVYLAGLFLTHLFRLDEPGPDDGPPAA